MKPPRRSGALLLGAVTLGVLGVLAWGLLQDPTESWQRLPDGSRFRILGVTYGTGHRVVEGQVWQRLLLPLLPQRTPVPRPLLTGGFRVPASGMAIPISSRTGMFGGVERWFTTPKPSLIVWVRYRDARFHLGMRDFDGADEHSCRFPCENHWFPDFNTGEVLELLEFTSFSRRSPTLRLRLDDPLLPWADRPTFTVQIPPPGPQPTWQAHPLPARAQRGPLTVSLTRWEPRRPIPTAEFEVRSGGKLTLGWEPVTLTVSDATGNSRTSPRFQQYEADPRRFGFLGLCFREAAWKLHTEFVPALPARPTGIDPNWSPAPKAPPSWRWTAQIPAPRAGGRTVGGPKLERPELELELLGAAMPGTVPASDWGLGRLRCPAVRVRLNRAKERFRLTLVRVSDEKGRSAVPMWQESPMERRWDFTLPRPSHLFGPDFQERSFVLPELPGARTLKLEFVAHRVVPLEFLVAPPENPWARRREDRVTRSPGIRHSRE